MHRPCGFFGEWEGNLGLFLSMRDCQTCATGAATSHMMTGIASCGLRVVARYHLKPNNMVHGSEHYRL